MVLLSRLESADSGDVVQLDGKGSVTCERNGRQLGWSSLLWDWSWLGHPPPPVPHLLSLRQGWHGIRITGRVPSPAPSMPPATPRSVTTSPCRTSAPTWSRQATGRRTSR